MYIHTSVDPPPILSPNHPYQRSYHYHTHHDHLLSQLFYLTLSCSPLCSSSSCSSFILAHTVLYSPSTDRPLLTGKDREPNNHAANRFTSRPRCLRLASIKMSVAKNILNVADELITGRSRVPDSWLVLS